MIKKIMIMCLLVLFPCTMFASEQLAIYEIKIKEGFTKIALVQEAGGDQEEIKKEMINLLKIFIEKQIYEKKLASIADDEPTIGELYAATQNHDAYMYSSFQQNISTTNRKTNLNVGNTFRSYGFKDFSTRDHQGVSKRATQVGIVGGRASRFDIDYSWFLDDEDLQGNIENQYIRVDDFDDSQNLMTQTSWVDKDKLSQYSGEWIKLPKNEKSTLSLLATPSTLIMDLIVKDVEGQLFTIDWSRQKTVLRTDNLFIDDTPIINYPLIFDREKLWNALSENPSSIRHRDLLKDSYKDFVASGGTFMESAISVLPDNKIYKINAGIISSGEEEYTRDEVWMVKLYTDDPDLRGFEQINDPGRKANDEMTVKEFNEYLF